MLRSAIAAAALAAVPTMTAVQTQIVDEFKFGILDKHIEAGADINFEMLFTPPAFLGGSR